MIEKKVYIWKLASFLDCNGTKMSGKELANHLNRNKFKTTYNTDFKGERGTYKLIEETYKWLLNLGLPQEASKIANTYLNKKGRYAYEN